MLFLNPPLLIGLVALAIPVAVHFFARRRYDEVDWAAMQFLRLSPKSRQKLRLEQWLLLAIRMAALGLLATGLAAPAVRSSLLPAAREQRPRDTVILIDCSASMAYPHDGRTGLEGAKRTAADFLARMRPGDRVAIFAVKGDVVPVVGTLTADPKAPAAALELLPEPRGSADWPVAVTAGVALLADSPHGAELLVLTDGQRFGWADADTLARWELLARKFAAEGRTLPPIWVMNVAADRPANPGTVALRPITSNRPVATAGATVTFECGIQQTGSAAALPRVRLEIDGRAAGEIALPPTAKPGTDFAFRFARRVAAGPHRITLRLDPASPPGDRQDFALDVLPVIPVLIVDGEPRPDTGTRGSDFLRDALAPARDPAPSFVVRSVLASQFTPAVLTQEVKGTGTPPRVLVLANLAAPTAEQNAAVERFLADGGGVLATFGDRAEPAEWNRTTYRDGRGWLPARLAQVITTDGDPTAAPKPRPTAFAHPAVRAFRDELPGGLHTAYFPRYWRLEPEPGLGTAAVLGALTTGDPLLVGKHVGSGRVLMSAVPLDNTWRTNLVGLPDFVRLAHELAYALAAGSEAGANLAAGEPIVFRPHDDEPPSSVTIVPPNGLAKVVPVRTWPAVFEATHDPGPYRLTTGSGKVHHYAVWADPREADLTPADDADQAKVAQLLGRVEVVSDLTELRERRGRGPVTHEIDGLVLFAVLALLATELWYTRRLTAKG